MEGSEGGVNLGKPILVPSVQELAEGFLDRLPERYVQPFDQQPMTIIGDNEEEGDGDDEHQVPIIDMEALNSGDEVQLHKLHSASQHWGFFQIINHGVSSWLVEEFKSQTQQFFKLPMQEKKKFWQTPTELEGFGQLFVASEDQKLDWADIFYVITFPKHLRKPYLFPMLPLPYRDTMEGYTVEMRKLGGNILDHMGKALNIDIDLKSYVLGSQSIRINYYPPCPEPNKAIGIRPHTDSAALLTILLQLNDMQGLQVYHNNNWVTVTPLPGAFVVNIGDILEIMTNGIYKSILHRSVVNATKERISVATFHSPAFDHEVGPIPKLVTSTNPAKFGRVIMADYWKAFFARPLDGKDFLDTFKTAS